MPKPTPQTIGQQYGRRSWAEPWKIKMVEPISVVSRDVREAALKRSWLQHLPVCAPTMSTSTYSQTAVPAP